MSDVFFILNINIINQIIIISNFSMRFYINICLHFYVSTNEVKSRSLEKKSMMTNGSHTMIYKPHKNLNNPRQNKTITRVDRSFITIHKKTEKNHLLNKNI